MKIATAAKILLAAALAVAAYAGAREVTKPAVGVVAAKRGTAVATVTGSVTVMPALEARVTAPERGTLLKFGLTEGDLVKKDDIIAEIDAGRLPFDLKAAEDELAKLKERKERGPTRAAERERIADRLAKARKLRESGNASAAAVLDLESQLAGVDSFIALENLETEHAIRRAENQVALWRNQLERYTARAPFDGVIMAPAAVAGDLLFAGNTITKISSGALLIKAEVNQDDVAAVRGCKRVHVRFFSFPGENYEAEVQTLVTVGNSSTQRFTVFLKMPKRPAGLMSGQTGEANFIAGEARDALLVPVGALVGGSVFVLKNGRLEQRKVGVGIISLSTAQITSGLAEGEQVVCEEVDQQRDGDRVRARPAKIKW
ncbi:MAG: efflux RND transporter periplasmic adaptor subunit [Puniceicoccales bacterium]|jgi:RND family efflux transporter MFP subunit|nr:efflux RND transporter periplasmic adaptor subunit [Puniceicoccales bacterium]